MIDFDKEEFLTRLDARLLTMASMLAYHEKFLIAYINPKEKSKTYEQVIDDAVKHFGKQLSNHDKEIKDYFDKLRDNYKNE